MNTYSVIRSSNPTKGEKTTTVQAEGLSWEAAKQLRDKLQKEENEKHPNLTSWTKDIFFCELERASHG